MRYKQYILDNMSKAIKRLLKLIQKQSHTQFGYGSVFQESILLTC